MTVKELFDFVVDLTINESNIEVDLYCPTNMSIIRSNFWKR